MLLNNQISEINIVTNMKESGLYWYKRQAFIHEVRYPLVTYSTDNSRELKWNFLCFGNINVNLFEAGTIYQLGNAPSHFHWEIRAYLDTVFPTEWIGQAGPTD
jgi:hypothetical protein